MIQIEKLTVAYSNNKVLDEVSILFETGKTHVILGSSGSGKSTLLRAVLGLVPMTAGSVTINHVPTTQMSPALRAQQMGYVPQDAELFPHLNIQDNITLVARAQGWPKNKIQERLQEINSILPLGQNLAHRYPHEISGGQRQRVALQRALFLNPDAVILDEPFGALDPVIRSDIQREVRDLFQRLQKTVLFVTHDIREANFLADNIFLMNEGRVVQSGSMSNLIKSPATPFVSLFIQAQRPFPTE